MADTKITPPPAKLRFGPQSNTEIIPPAVNSPPETRRNKGGRPGVKAIALAIFEARRQRGVALNPTAIGEARAILKKWPKDGPAKPTDETVRDHISQRWRQERQNRD